MSGDQICPSCGKDNPPNAMRCTCGHQFLSGTQPIQAPAPLPPVRIPITAPDTPARSFQVHKSTDASRIVAGCLAGLVLCWVLFSECSGKPDHKDDAPTAQYTAPSVPAHQSTDAGQVCLIARDTWIVFYEPDVDEMVRFLIAKDSRGLAEMLATGRMAYLDAGSHVLSLGPAPNSNSMEVRATDGSLNGRRGYVLNESLK